MAISDHKLHCVMRQNVSYYDELITLLLEARRITTGVPQAQDLSSLLTVALSEAERLHKRGVLGPKSVQVILKNHLVSEEAPQAKDERE